MCHTGGPRCYEDAKNSLINARKEFADNPTPETKLALREAEKDIILTPEYIENLKKTKPSEAASIQHAYDQKLAGAKEYERFRSESTRTLSRLDEERAEALKQVASIEAQITRFDNQMGSLLLDNYNGGFTSDDEMDYRQWEHDQNTSQLEDEKKMHLDKAGLIKQRIDTMTAANEENLRRRKEGLPLNHSHLMPAKFAGYFADTERKHFSSATEGSTFTKAKNLNEVLAETAKQRKSLEGDDRDKLIARGADPSSFQADKRYLMVETKGRLGTVLASELDDNQQVTVVQKSEKATPVCVAEVERQKDTDFATVVLLDNPSLPGTEKHPTLLITAFPGASGPSGSNKELLPHVGKTMTVGEAKKFYGRDFTINTVVKA